MVRRTSALIVAIVMLSFAACEANGAVLIELPSGEVYCQDDWDQSEVDRRTIDVVGFSPGRTCSDLGYSRHCPGDPDTVFFLPPHQC